MGVVPIGSLSGAASQHAGPSVHVGLEPVGAVQYLPKWPSNVWFSCTMMTTCLIAVAGQAPAQPGSASGPASAPPSPPGGPPGFELEHANATRGTAKVKPT